jgi:hypothetical protein
MGLALFPGQRLSMSWKRLNAIHLRDPARNSLVKEPAKACTSSPLPIPDDDTTLRGTGFTAVNGTATNLQWGQDDGGYINSGSFICRWCPPYMLGHSLDLRASS